MQSEFDAWNTRESQPCYADEADHSRCKYSVNRGWVKRTCRLEERHGDWYCTNCDEMVGTFDPDSELFIDGNAIEEWQYCPKCGAKVVK